MNGKRTQLDGLNLKILRKVVCLDKISKLLGRGNVIKHKVGILAKLEWTGVSL